MQQQKGNRYRIHIFSLCYLLSMISYAAITTMMYSLYNRNGLGKLALLNGIMAFLGFGPSNMIVLNLIRRFNLRNALACGFGGLALYQLVIMGTIIGVDKNVPIISNNIVLYVINIVCSFVTGILNSIIWTVMPTYIQQHCNIVQPQLSPNPNQAQTANSISATMGLFWSIFMWSSIVGGLVNIFVLGFVNFYAYMVILAVLAGMFYIIFLAGSVAMVVVFVQPFEVPDIGYNARQTTIVQGIKQQFSYLINILKQQRAIPNIFLYNFIAGLLLNFYPIFMNTLIEKSLPEDIPQAEHNRSTAIVFIFQGVGCMLAGLIQNRLYFLVSQNKQKALIWGFCFVLCVMMVTMYAYNVMEHGSGYWLCIFTIFIWALTQIHIKTNTQAYIRQYNGGRIQYYSLSILSYSIGSIFNYSVQILDDGNMEMILIMFIGSFVYCVWVLREPDIQAMGDDHDQLPTNNSNIETVLTEQSNKHK